MLHNIILWEFEDSYELTAEIWSTTQLFYSSPLKTALNKEQAAQL